ncbi:hypothetical protein G7062_11375 [Erysipelothrix sp. HDW6C]|uniref:hypothetical protein n=1 Tax=Erysipelothrix sp. HDW6C TaxID=2714930 RepID=UPI00140E638F|nr:hypothetical protein [Erysipelothrix sp. HDW6C]QIK70858.1 hypothetical protein G7062_11375 [Erysipelothrix sp. HDW6C]
MSERKEVTEANGYQEALDTIIKFCLSVPANGQGEEMGFTEDFDFDHDACETECSLLQKLVDKETPMNPNFEEDTCTKSCPKCNGWSIMDYNYTMRAFNYCTDCGQKIDWSDEE